MEMHEKIMNLPLLRGVATEHLVSFLEKAHLEFETYDAGDSIIAEREKCGAVRCLISGSVEISHVLFDGRLIVTEQADEGFFFGIERLFGMDNRLRFSARALTRCGTMQFSKAQYMELLKSDKIFLMNCLNHLSRSAQRYEDVFCNSRIGDALHFLAAIVDVTTMRQSRNISLITPGSSISEVLHIENCDNISELEVLEKEGIIRRESGSIIRIIDRNALVNRILEC